MTGNPLRLGVTCAILFAMAVLAVPASAGPADQARKAAEEGAWQEAADAWADVLAKAPADREAALGLTEAAVQAAATDLYHLAEDALLTLREKNAKDAEVLIALGRISLAQSAAKEDTLAKKSYDTQATDSFQRVLQMDPANGDAAAGLARVYFQTADFQKAIDVVDAFLARQPENAGKALFWKGQALYYMANDAFRAAGGTFPLDDEVAATFRKAQGAFQGAAAGDPENYDAWMQLGYASAWLSDRDAAIEAYRKALALDTHSPYPFKGIESLLQHDAEALASVLGSIVETHPQHPQALYYLAHNRRAAGAHKEAIDLFERYVAVGKEPSTGWYWLGKTAEDAGNAELAVKAFREALKADPGNEYAAWELDVRIQKTGAMQRARKSLSDAKQVIAEYQPLLKLAPRNATVRNNLAFTLREAYVAHQASAQWIPILKASTKYYVEASDILGPWTAQKEATLPWQKRYAQAQIISDTGLMFQFYEPTRDMDKAIEYYERALEYTADGYRDAVNNYVQILISQERWDEAYELARSGQDSIRLENGNPDVQAREAMKTIADRLLAQGKVER